MSKKLMLSVMTPERVLFEGEITYLSVPGGAGFMGILVDHAPLISSLKAGPFEVRPVSEKTLRFSTTRKGFFEISANQATILLDAADSLALSMPKKTS
ncbi:MAG: F0F1 ATP synthase subunit epsilon [Candidatus Omnitrophica bacterium]|nr:F0F1 ATP synthase subunit epsilon [Candidatus Omnitrophota bacterium]